MSQISNVPASFTPAAMPQAPMADAAPPAAGVRALDSAALLGTQARSGAAASSGTALITNSNGAPAIGGITINFSAEDLTAALAVLQGKTQDAQLRTAQEGLGVTRQKMEENHKKSLEKIETWIKKCESAAAKSKLGGIFGWIAKIAAFVASAIATVALAVATPFTAGATAPLLALAVIGLVGSTMSLASAISQASGGPALEIGTLMTKACSAFLKAVGVPEEKLEAASRIMAGAIGGITGAVLADPQLLGGMVSSVAQLSITDQNKAAIVGAIFSTLACIALTVATTVATAGAGAGKAAADIAKALPQAATTVATTVAKTGAESSKLLTDVLKALPQMAKIAQHTASATSAVASTVQGGLNVGVAIDEHAAASAQVDRKLFSAMLVKLQAQMEEDQEQIKKVVEEIQNGLSVVSQMIAAAGESRSQIAANIGRSMA